MKLTRRPQRGCFATKPITSPLRFILVLALEAVDCAPEVSARVNRLLDGFEGKLTSAKWAAIAKCSSDTALRDISDLLARGLLRKLEAGGRSTGYELAD